MSIEANTYEELTIHNVNEKTAQLCATIGEYLITTWGINYISLTVDGICYDAIEDESITEEDEMYSVCQNLASAKEISFKIRSCNNGGFYWRSDTFLGKHLTDDTEIAKNVTYRSTDYYDTDSGVEMHLYNENGMQLIDYTDSSDSVADITKWYCYTPDFHIVDDEQKDNQETYKKTQSIISEMCNLLDVDEENTDDCWEEYGEYVVNGSVRFENKDIPEIVDLANQLYDLFKDSESAEFKFAIYAVPDGVNDYDFASVAIELDGETIKDKYCRF